MRSYRRRAHTPHHYHARAIVIARPLAQHTSFASMPTTEKKSPASLSEIGYDPDRLCVVIAARDEERTIADAVRSAFLYSRNVIVMDGHSSDATARLAREAGATVFTDPGRGKGAAIRDALNRTDAEVVAFMDADGSHDPADIPRLASVIMSGAADLCIGCRFTGGSDEVSLSVGQLIRTVGNISMNIAINNRWNVRLTDTLNGFRAARRAAAVEVGLTEDRHTIEQEMVMKFLRHGYAVTNIACHEYSRKFGESHIHIWREWPLFVWCVVKNVVARDLPQKAALLPAAADPIEIVEPGQNVAGL